MKIGKFKDFSKNRKINENNPALMSQPAQLSDELPMVSKDGTKVTPQVPTKPAPPVTPGKEKIEQPVETPQRKAYVEEEDTIGEIETKLSDLMEALNSTEFGIATMENGIIKFQTEVGGMKRIFDVEFISETMSFTINKQSKVVIKGKKQELRTIEDVLMYFENMLVPGQAQVQAPYSAQKRPQSISERRMNLPKASHMKTTHSGESTLDKLQDLDMSYKRMERDIEIGNVELPKSIEDLDQKIMEVETLLRFKFTEKMMNYLETLKSMKQYFR